MRRNAPRLYPAQAQALALGLLLLFSSQALGLPHPQEEGEGEAEQEVEDADELVASGKVRKYAFGVLEPSEDDLIDEESVAYFEDVGSSNLVGAPASFNAVSLGLVTPVMDQGNCGSCAAFATASIAETCFRRKMGRHTLFSEQWLLDCAYGYQGAYACNGALIQAYPFYMANKRKIVSYSMYPYYGRLGACPTNVAPLIGEKLFSVTYAYYTYSGSEELLKSLVAEQGAVGVSISIAQSTINQLYAYRKGVFNGCTAGAIAVRHAVAVVGYGSQSGQDYWLIKNSWGTAFWPENPAT